MTWEVFAPRNMLGAVLLLMKAKVLCRLWVGVARISRCPTHWQARSARPEFCSLVLLRKTSVSLSLSSNNFYFILESNSVHLEACCPM